MASSQKVVPKLFAVTQIRSKIGRPYWEKRTMKALGFKKMRQTIVVKNTPIVNGQLLAVKNLVQVVPIRVMDEIHPDTAKDLEFLEKTGFDKKYAVDSPYLKPDGTFDMASYCKYLELTKSESEKVDTSTSALSTEAGNDMKLKET